MAKIKSPMRIASNCRKEGFLATIFSVLVACLPFLYQYATPISVLSLGEALLLPFILIYLASDLKTGIENNSFCGFYMLMVLVVFVNSVALIIQPYASFTKSSTVILRLTYYALLIYVGRKRVNIDVLLVTLVFGATANSLYTIVQYVTHTVFGLDLPTTLQFLPVFGEENIQGRTDLVEYYRYNFRPSGLFLEPSYAAFFSAPGLLISLLHKEYGGKPYSRVAAGIITLGLIVGTSSMALIAIVLGWACFAFRRFITRNSMGQVVISPTGFFVSLALCGLVVFALLSPLGEMTLSRLDISNGSAGQRIIRGWLIASQLDAKTLLVGTGLNNVAEFVLRSGITTQFDEANLDYLSSWSSALVCSGIFVLFGYIMFMGRLFGKENTTIGKVFVFLFVITGFVEAMLYTYRFAFYLLIAFSFISNDIHLPRESKRWNSKSHNRS